MLVKLAIFRHLLCWTLIGAFLLPMGALAAALSEVTGLLQQGNYAQAEPILRQVLSAEDNPQAQSLLGFLLIQTYRYDESEQQLRQAVAARPLQHRWLMVLAKSLLEQSKNLAAGEVLEQAIAIDPQPAYYHALAMTAFNTGDLERAEASLRACLELEAEHDDALFRLGGLLIDQGRSEEGIVYLERAWELNQQNLEALYSLGMAYRYMGLWEKSEELLLEIVKRVPSHVGALYNLSRVQMKLGKVEESELVMEQFRGMSELRDKIDFNAYAVRMNPKNTEGRLLLATLYQRAGRLRDALSELLAARVQAPRDARIYRLLATTYRSLGDENNAVRAEQFAASIEG